MRKFFIVSAALAGLAVTPALAGGVDVTIEPEVDSWVMGYDSPTVVYDGDVVVGSALPDTVQFVEVPKHKKYRYVRLNKKRVLIDANTRKVIKIYE